MAKEGELNILELVKEQNFLMQSVQTTLRNFKKDSATRKSVPYYNARLETLASYRTEFRANHRELIRQSKNAEIRESYIDAGTCEKFEEIYLDAVVYIRESLSEKFTPVATEVAQTSSLNNSSTTTAASGVPLPEVKLTSFSGKYIEWPAFKEIFLDRVHGNASLNNLQRFHYLKSVLTDIAAQDIEHISLVGENYLEAWKMLCEQYDNKRILFTHYMDVLDQQPDVIREDPTSLKHFTQTCRACVNSISKLGINVEQNQILVYYMVKRLPNHLRTEWDRSLRKQTSIPTFSEFCSLLDEQYLLMITSSRTSAKPTQTHQANITSHRKSEGMPSYSKKYIKSMHVGKKAITCPICEKSDHPVRECPKFVEMGVVEKRAAVERYKLCFNCLGYNHQSSRCNSRRTCGTCGARHHTLIHIDREVAASAASVTAPASISAMHVAATQEIREQFSQQLPSIQYDVLLPTAIVTIKSFTGQSCYFRALLDQGSQATFLSERAMQTLGLPRRKGQIEVTGLSGSRVTTSRFCVNISVGSRMDAHEQYQAVAYVLPRVCGVLPSQRITTTFDYLDGLHLADPKYFEPNSVDVLLGNDIYDECILSDVRRGGSGLPIAQNTTFGYIISGKNATSSLTPKAVSFLSMNMELEVDDLLRKFWELEEVGGSGSLNTEDIWCENLYRNSHKRLDNGKYIVRLPLKSEVDASCFIGKSRATALKRFLHLEGRLSKDANLREIYINTINEYRQLGQMKPVKSTEEQHCTAVAINDNRLTCCYLPHHPVVKADAVSTKVRVVFDASMRTSNGKSLNDILATGPALQQDLSAVIMNWRTMKYVFIADIEKMFRCIDVDEEDAQYQRILWREEPAQPIREYYCSTVMFGTASAPYTAIRTIHQLAQDEAERFPLAVKVLKQQIYVDDILSGGKSIESALRVRDETIAMLRSASFELRKWASNHPSLLDKIPAEHRQSKDKMQFTSADPIKALGLYWDPVTDEFEFKADFKFGIENPTKRTILSNIARLFDPLGWLNPVIISAKLILQELWCSKVGWDTPLPTELRSTWRTFGEDFHQISQLKVPRWIMFDHTKGCCELHVFCDASIHAHSAVAYLRGTIENGKVFTTMLTAKCKVNPIKPKITIPRAELCGAVLASKLLKFIISNISIAVNRSNIFMWTDSSIVLYWIRGDPHRWKIFVSNRINQILENTSVSQWRHVTSENNPADISSRGISPSRLSHSDLWWRGPAFLQLPFAEWPKSALNTDLVPPSIDIEKRSIKTHLSTTDGTNENLSLSKWSCFSLTMRVMAYCIRFGKNCRPKLWSRSKGALSSMELQRSVLCITGMIQREEFPEDWRALSRNRPLPSNSKLRSLNPYFDEQSKVIRVGGRLKEALLSIDRKHPYILPSKHHVTALIVKHSHLNTLHGGVTLTLNHIRRKFWILNGRNVVRTVIHGCITCFKQNPKPCAQRMGNLPAERVRPARAFSSVGVDYAGPFNILPSKGRGRVSIKGYISLFICLATKAIHLELVGDLTTDAFIGALNRFIGRRGLCSNIYSDCGTNFIGANGKLQADRTAYQHFINNQVGPHLAEREVRWHFIPPSSPHFGGLWEAGVKSVKYHLKRTIGEQKLTYEEFNTVLVQIEACLNSRPLCPLSNDVDDLMVLTPGHFLVGDCLLALPSIETNRLSLAERWRHGQNLVQQFWKQWNTEYLSRLQRRPKWLNPNPNLKVGDIVLIKDERYPYNRWPLAKIVELHPGTDNLVRVVSLKTQKGLVKRPVVKICPLPIQDSWTPIDDQAH